MYSFQNKFLNLQKMNLKTKNHDDVIIKVDTLCVMS